MPDEFLIQALSRWPVLSENVEDPEQRTFH